MSLFDNSALIMAAIAFLLFDNKSSKLTLVCLLVFAILSAVNMFHFAEYYYVFIMLIDFAFLYAVTKYNLNLSYSIIFFISILYNGLSFLEYNSQYTIIYSAYTAVNTLLVTGLVLTSYYDGLKGNGRSSTDNKPRNSSDSISSGGFQARSTL